jgi:hypothetical protein
MGKIIVALGILVLEGGWIIYWVLLEKTFCIDPPAYNLILIFIGGLSGILAFVGAIIGIFAFPPEKIAISKRSMQIGLIITAILTGAVVTSATNGFDPNYHAIVPAAGERTPMEFSFWGDLNPGNYNPDRWDQLNRHRAILIVYEFGEFDREDTYAAVQMLRDTYPSIRIMFPLHGSYFHADQYVPMAQEYLTAIEDYNLTNVIGFNFDIERENDTCAHDAAQLTIARTNLAEAIALIKDHHPEYRIDNTDGIWMMFEGLPFANSFELYKQHALMSIEGWDHYAWQLYRGNAVDPASDPDSTDIYERIASSVALLGANATIPLFGMTGVGDYGPNNCSLAGGSGCNFAGVIRDCRIARSLGVSQVQFYTLTSAGTYQGVYYPSMFEAYGEDFLDVLNASVNGLATPLALTIPGRIFMRSTFGYYLENMAYSLTAGGFFSLIGLAAGSTAIWHQYIARKKNKKD